MASVVGYDVLQNIKQPLSTNHIQEFSDIWTEWCYFADPHIFVWASEVLFIKIYN